MKIYCTLKLTQATDALPALSGAAKLTSLHRSGDPYLAGHFKSTLPASLCWRAKAPLRKARPRVAPTWSWLSAISGSGIDIWQPDNPFCIAQLVDANCEPLGKDPTGHVAVGSVLLASRLHQATVERNPEHEGINVGVFLHSQQYALRISGELHGYFYVDQELAENCEGKSLWCLELTGATVNRRRDHWVQKTNVACQTALVLDRVGGEPSTTYQRVGLLLTLGLP